MGPSLRNLTDKELVRYFDQSGSPELREAADRLQELIELRRRLEAIEEELANKAALLECNEREIADIAEELASQQLHTA
jgi:hypothetical protein